MQKANETKIDTYPTLCICPIVLLFYGYIDRVLLGSEVTKHWNNAQSTQNVQQLTTEAFRKVY